MKAVVGEEARSRSQKIDRFQGVTNQWEWVPKYVTQGAIQHEPTVFCSVESIVAACGLSGEDIGLSRFTFMCLLMLLCLWFSAISCYVGSIFGLYFEIYFCILCVLFHGFVPF